MHDGQAYGQGLAEVVTRRVHGPGRRGVSIQRHHPGRIRLQRRSGGCGLQEPRSPVLWRLRRRSRGGRQPDEAERPDGVVFFGGDGTFGADFLDRTAANGEGAYSTALIPAASDAKTKFDATYLADFGTEAGSSPHTPGPHTTPLPCWRLVKQIESVAIMGSDGNLYIPRGALIAAVRATKDYKGFRHDHL